MFLLVKTNSQSTSQSFLLGRSNIVFFSQLFSLVFYSHSLFLYHKSIAKTHKPNCLYGTAVYGAVMTGNIILYWWRQDVCDMSSLTPILTLQQSTEFAVDWAMQKLLAHGFQVERTFDLQAARQTHVDCACPYHGTKHCTCQMVIVMVHFEMHLVTIVAHGQDSHTCLSLVDGASRALDQRVAQALLPAPENSKNQAQRLRTGKEIKNPNRILSKNRNGRL